MSSPLFDENLISGKWIKNHYKWIVWKLASYEVKYPEQLGNKYVLIFPRFAYKLWEKLVN